MNERDFEDRNTQGVNRDQDTGERLTTAELAAATEPASRTSEMNTAAQGRPSAAQAVAARSAEETNEPLFDEGESQEFRSRWERIQAGFVDEPHSAVEQADELVATVIKRLADIFAKERAGLEQEWAKGDNVSTEDLRIALRRYRSFFDRLLSV